MESEIDSLYSEIASLARIAGLDGEILPRPDRKEQEDGLWIDATSSGLLLLYQERGQVHIKAGGTYDDILFEALSRAAADAASRLEMRQRLSGEDSRRRWFAIQADLMAQMKPEWRERTSAKHTKLLQDHPFRDDR